MDASSSRLICTEPMMQPQVVFGISVLLGFVVWGMIDSCYSRSQRWEVG
jgi:hypothetical protein